MTRNLLNSTTAVLASLSLALPHAAMAQTDAESTETPVELCADGSQAPCDIIEDATGAEPEIAAEAEVAPEEEATPEVEAEAAPEPAPEAEVAPEAEAAPEVQETPQAEADTAPDAGNAQEAEAPAEAEAPVEAEPSVEAEAPVEPDVPAEDAATDALRDALDEAAPADDTPATEAEAEAEAEVAPEAQPEASTETAGDAETGTREAASADADADADADALEEALTEQDVQADSAAESETIAEDTAQPETGTETEPEETAETSPAEATPEDAPEDAEVAQQDTEISTDEANETVSVAAGAEEDTDAGEVLETTTVTEQDARSSDQEFTDATAADANADDDDGLSNFQKFALGALAVGAASYLLKNKDDKVVSNTGDRVVVQRADGNYYVLKDDDVLLRRPGNEVETRQFDDGSTRQTINRADGSRVVTIRAANGQVLRRTRVMPDGTQVLLFDDTATATPVDISTLPLPAQRTQRFSASNATSEELRQALRQAEIADLDRRFTLQQVRQIRAVRELVPEIELSAVTFDSGSAAIRATEAEELRALGVALREAIAENPRDVFLIEGHTDAVGSANSNLALSDRRAESVALALTEYFDVPPENLVAQGYGEANLKVVAQGDIRENRRAAVRRITPLLQTASN